MTTVPIQSQLVRFDEIYPETKSIAVLQQEPPELEERGSPKFNEGYDDLDYLVFSVLELPSCHRVAFVRHKYSPSPGTEVRVVFYEPEVVKTLTETIQFLELSAEDLSWIHPQYESDIAYSLNLVNLLEQFKPTYAKKDEAYSNFTSKRFQITVAQAGNANIAKVRRIDETYVVPYAQLSQQLQNIQRIGGKIIGITEV